MDRYKIHQFHLRINPLNALKQHHVGQHVAIWILLPLYGIYVILESICKYSVYISTLKLMQTPYENIIFFSINFCRGPDQGCTLDTIFSTCKEREDV